MLLKNLTPGSLYVEDLLFYNFETKEIPYEQWAAKYSKSVQIKKLIKERKMASSVPVAEAINEIQTSIPPGVNLTTYRNPFRGTVETVEDLPMERNLPGDWFEIYSSFNSRYWNGEKWVLFGSGGDQEVVTHDDTLSGSGTKEDPLKVSDVLKNKVNSSLQEVSHDSNLKGKGTSSDPLKVSESITSNLVPENGSFGQIIGADEEGKANWRDEKLLTVDPSAGQVLDIDEKYKLKAKESSFTTDNGVPVWMSRVPYGNGENYLLVWNADLPIDLETNLPPNTALGGSNVDIVLRSSAVTAWKIDSQEKRNDTSVYVVNGIPGGGPYGNQVTLRNGANFGTNNSVFSFFVKIRNLSYTNLMLLSVVSSDGSPFEIRQEGGRIVFRAFQNTGGYTDYFVSDFEENPKWHFCLVSIDRTTKQCFFYFDGFKKASFVMRDSIQNFQGYLVGGPNQCNSFLDQIQWWEVDDEEIKLYQGDTIPVPTSESGVTSKITTEIHERQKDESFTLWGQSSRGLVRVNPADLSGGNISIATIKSINGNTAVLSVGTLNDENKLVSDKEVNAILGWEKA